MSYSFPPSATSPHAQFTLLHNANLFRSCSRLFIDVLVMSAPYVRLIFFFLDSELLVGTLDDMTPAGQDGLLHVVPSVSDFGAWENNAGTAYPAAGSNPTRSPAFPSSAAARPPSLLASVRNQSRNNQIKPCKFPRSSSRAPRSQPTPDPNPCQIS